MKRIFTLSALFFGITMSAFATTRYWTGASGGNWSTAANWNTVADASGSTGAPSSIDDAIIDGDNVTIVIDASVTLNSFTINGNATVIFTVTATATRNFITNNSSATTRQFSIESGSSLTLRATASGAAKIVIQPTGGTIATPEAIVDGILICEGTGSATASADCKVDASGQGGCFVVNGTYRCGLNSGNPVQGSGNNVIIFGPNSVFEWTENGGSLGAFTYDNTATLKLNSGTSFPSFNSSTLSYGNIEFNSTTNTTALSVGFPNSCVINGNLTFTNTNGQSVKLVTTGTNSVILKGNLSISSTSLVSLFIVSSGTGIFTVKGNITNNGVFRINENATAAGISLNVEGNVTCGASSQMFANKGGTVSTTPIIRIAGTVTQTLDFQNLHGANINMIFGNADNIVLARDIDTLRYSSSITGKLSLGSYNIALDGTTATSPGGASNYIVTNGTGKLTILNITSSGKDFRIGSSTSSYDPILVTPTTTADFSASVKQTFTNTVANAAKVTPREWSVSTTGSPGATSLELKPDDAVTYNPPSPVIGHYTGGVWTETAATYSNTGNFSGTTGNSYTASFTTFSPFGGGTVGGFDVALPLEFTHIDAQPKGNLNIINWTTANEVNIKEFAIESSSDNRIWRTIGNKAATGGSKTTTYTYNDETPSVLNYYRIKSIEFSGKEQTSKVVAVKRNGSKFTLVAVSPIPTTEGVTIDFTIAKNSRLTATITDIVGKVVKTQSIETIEGNNSMRLDLSNMTKGIYILSLNDGETIVTQRIIKQ